MWTVEAQTGLFGFPTFSRMRFTMWKITTTSSSPSTRINLHNQTIPSKLYYQPKQTKVSLVRLWPRSGHQTKDSTSFCYTVSISLNSIIQDPRSYLRTVLEILNWTFFRPQCLPCLPGSKDWKLREEANHCSIMENHISNAISVNAEFSQIALESSFQNLPISAAGMPCQSDW